MEKGISFFFGYLTPPEERAFFIKQCGLTSVIANADKKWDYQNSPLKNQVKIFKKYNIKLSSLHMAYNKEDLPSFWTKGPKGNYLTKRLIKDVKIAKKYGFRCVVVHLDGVYSEIGKKRLWQVLKVCEKTNIPLAIENLNNQILFEEVFSNIESPFMKVCYDCGHGNIWDSNFSWIKKYKDKIITLHLHSNDGKRDLHTLNRMGTVKWHMVAEILKNNKNIISLDYEILPRDYKGLTQIECLQEIKKQADQFEKMLNLVNKKEL